MHSGIIPINVINYGNIGKLSSVRTLAGEQAGFGGGGGGGVVGETLKVMCIAARFCIVHQL